MIVALPGLFACLFFFFFFFFFSFFYTHHSDSRRIEVPLSVLDWFTSFPKAKNESYLVTYRKYYSGANMLYSNVSTMESKGPFQ